MTEDDDELYGEVFSPETLRCFQRINNDEIVAEGFTSATVHLDLTPNSNLDWKSAVDSAQKLISQGYKIIFDLDFGLFQEGWKGFTHQGYFQSSVFAMAHFSNTILPQFEESVIAVIVAKLDLPFSKLDLKTCEEGESKSELAYANMTAHYLTLLCEELPYTLTRILLISSDKVSDPLLFSQCVINDYFDEFWLAIASSASYCKWGVWQQGIGNSGFIGRTPPQEAPQPTTALLFSTAAHEQNGFIQGIHYLTEQNRPYKIIYEEAFTQEWQGIDTLIVTTKTASQATKRAIDGFRAAGGQTILLESHS